MSVLFLLLGVTFCLVPCAGAGTAVPNARGGRAGDGEEGLAGQPQHRGGPQVLMSPRFGIPWVLCYRMKNPVGA